jgi:hypothetical protein
LASESGEVSDDDLPAGGVEVSSTQDEIDNND